MREAGNEVADMAQVTGPVQHAARIVERESRPRAIAVGLLSPLNQAIRPNFTIGAMVALYAGVSAVVAHIFGVTLDFTIYNDLIVVVSVSLFVLTLCGLSLFSLYRERPERPFPFIWKKLTVDWAVPARLALGLPTFAILSLLFAVFTSMKSAIPKIVPYYADPYALVIDRFLHGADPWRILQPLTGHPFITLALDYSYGLWLGQFLLAIAISAFMLHNEGLRWQFLVSAVLSWTILGTLLATLLSSVGPCFYKFFFGSDVYGPLLGYLKGVQSNYHLFAMDAQNMLLHSYQTSETGVATGISALPSMHVASSALCALFFSRINKWLGIVNWTLTAVVIIASVHLAWHYAIDGYVSLILVVFIWKLAGRFAPRQQGAAVGLAQGT